MAEGVETSCSGCHSNGYNGEMPLGGNILEHGWFAAVRHLTYERAVACEDEVESDIGQFDDWMFPKVQDLHPTRCFHNL